MKKHIVLLSLLLISSVLSAQSFNTTSNYSYSGDIKNKTYLRAGFSTPSWKYFGYNNAAELKQALNVESKIGANFEVGTIYTFNQLPIARGVRFAINVDYLSLKAQIFNLPGTENIYNLFIGSKVGPSIIIMPERGLAFNFYAKLNPIWVGGIYYNKQNYDDGLDAYLGYVQFMYSFGFDVKLAFFIVGFEYEFGGMKVSNTDGDYWGNASNPNTDYTPMPGFNLSLGLIF